MPVISKRRSLAACLLSTAAAVSGLLLATGCGGAVQGEATAAPTPRKPGAQKARRFLHVARSGSNRARGTRLHPWRTIQYALDRARPGDTVVVHAGTYSGRVVMRRDGTRSRRIVLRAAGRVVLLGRLRVRADHVTVQGFRFTGRTPANRSDVLVWVSGASDVLLAHNRLEHSAISAIFAGEESRDVRIVSNLIVRNGRSRALDHGIYLERVRGGLVANNVIARNAGYGVQLYPDTDGVRVLQNTVFANGNAGIILAGGRRGQASDGNVIANNVLADNGGAGIRTFWPRTVGRRNTVVTNLVYGNRGTVVGLGLGVTDTIRRDPGFVDAAAGDFRLRRTSPARDRAVASYSGRRDFAGVRRPQGRTPDLGAFEWRRPGR